MPSSEAAAGTLSHKQKLPVPWGCTEQARQRRGKGPLTGVDAGNSDSIHLGMGSSHLEMARGRTTVLCVRERAQQRASTCKRPVGESRGSSSCWRMAGEARMYPAPGHGSPGKRVHAGQTGLQTAENRERERRDADELTAQGVTAGGAQGKGPGQTRTTE